MNYLFVQEFHQIEIVLKTFQWNLWCIDQLSVLPLSADQRRNEASISCHHYYEVLWQVLGTMIRDLQYNIVKDFVSIVIKYYLCRNENLLLACQYE